MMDHAIQVHGLRKSYGSHIVLKELELPDFLEVIGRFFPASWGYRLMLDHGFCLENLCYLILVFFSAVIVCGILLKKQKSK